jgi:PAS domain S-box-containing protein
MAWQFNPFAIPMFLSSILLLVFAGVVYQRQMTLSVRLFMAFVLSVAGLNTAYGLELLAADLPTMMIWLKIEYIFHYIPVLWLFFVLAYIGYDRWLTPRRMIPVFIVPVVWTLLVWTNDQHYLNWTTVGTETVNGLVFFERTYGVVFHLGLGYSYTLTLITLLLMAFAIWRSPALYQGQIGWLLLAVTFPLAGSLLTVLNLAPVAHLDLLPFGYALACIPLGWSLFRYQLLDITPLAHRQIIEGMHDGVLVVDTAGRIVYVNEAAAQLSGQSANALIGRLLAEVFAQAHERLLSPADSSSPEFSLLLKGETRYFEPRVSRLYNRRQVLRGHVIVLRDVTERRRAEDIINQYALELEARNRELDAFAHTVAHDLKSPVTNIIGYSQILQMENEDQPGDRASLLKYLQRINQAGYKMSDMIDGLLVLAQLRQTETTLTWVDMNAVTRSAVERFEMETAQKGIQIEVEGTLPSVMGQAVWLEEVMANLISNAIKYIGQNNPAPRIVIRACQRPGKACFAVVDNGLGIQQQDRDRLFEKFSRFHQHEAYGLGLGLSIVLQIINRLNGEIGVESTPGQGSTFWFALPADERYQPVPTPLNGADAAPLYTQG